MPAMTLTPPFGNPRFWDSVSDTAKDLEREGEEIFSGFRVGEGGGGDALIIVAVTDGDQSLLR